MFGIYIKKTKRRDICIVVRRLFYVRDVFLYDEMYLIVFMCLG